jgi:hypothetical protein
MSALPEFLQFKRKRRLDGSPIEMPESYAPRRGDEVQPTGAQPAPAPMPQPTDAPSGGVALSQTQPPDDSRPEWMKMIPQVVENISTTPAPNASTPDAATRPRLVSPDVRESDVPVTDTLAPSAGLSDATRGVIREAARAYSPRPRSVEALPRALRPNQEIAPIDATLGTETTPQEIKPLPGVVNYDPDNQAMRDRVANPRDFVTKRVEDDALEPKPHDHNGRLKSTLIGVGRGALNGLVHGGLGGAIEGAAVGGISHAVDPSLDEQYAQSKNLADDRADAAQVIGAQDAQSKARINAANAGYLEDIKPTVALGGLDVKRRAQAEKAAYDGWRMKSGDHKQDTADAYVRWRMLNGDRRATTAEGQLELEREWRTVIQPAQFDRRQTEVESHNTVTEGQGQQRNDEKGRHDRVAESQVGQRIDETGRHNLATESKSGQPTARETNTRLARASELNRKLEEEKNRAAHPPFVINGEPTSEAYRAGYTARHKQAAAGYRDQIKNAYSDVYETGDDGNGWAYAKPKATPQTRAAAPAPAAAPQRMRMREADIPNAVDDLIKAGRYKDRSEAEAYVRANVEVVNQ